ncbi:hypothetical protein ABFY41_03135 [Acinetobacter haemolyticus]
MMLFKSLLSPIKSITSSLIDSNTSSASTSALAPLSLSTITNILSPTTVTNTISSITNDIDNNPLNTVTSIVGGSSGGLLTPITGIIGGISGGGDGGLLSPITGIIGGISGGGDGGLLSPITGIIGGIGGGDLGNNPVTGVIQTGIDILQGAESLKTTIINTGINTAADTILGVFPQAEHPVSDLANLGTLTFETSRDTVNGTLEAISDLAGANFGGALGNATGVIGTLINNGSTAAGIIQHVIGEDFIGGGILDGIGGGDGGLLSPITGIIGGIGGGDGGLLSPITGIIGGIGGDGSPLDLITGIIGGIGGGGDGGLLSPITGIIGGIGGGDLGNNPVTGVIQTGIDILQGVESLKTDLINTGINTVADTILGVFPQAEHPVSDLANLGTLTFETSRDTVNGTLEAISDLAGANFGGALGNATGVIGTLINNGSTAAGIIQHVIGEDILGGGIIGGIGGGDGGLLSPITGIIGGIGGIGGDGSPLDLITGIIGGIGGDGSPLDLITGIIGGIGGGDGSPLDLITGIIGGIGGIGGDGSPLDLITGIIGGIGGIGGDGSPLDLITGIIGGIGGIGGDGSPLDLITGIIGGIGGIGGDGSPLDLITGIIGGIGGIGGDGSPLDLITGIIGGIGGIGGDGSPLDLITGIIGGIGGGDGGSPLDILTGIIGGIGGGDLGNNPITGVIQTGIDILQGVESLKTDLINTGINTVADTILGVFPQAEHPVSDLANLGTLTFETSRDTVNGTLEAISDLAGANFGGALGNATGVIGTLINNGSTAAGIIQHVIGEDILGGGIIGGIGGGDGGLLSPITGIIGGIGGIGGDGSPLDLITGIIGGIGGIGGDGSPLDLITGIIGGIGGIGGDGSPLDLITGIIGGIGGGDGGSPLDILTGIIGGIGGGDLGNNPITGVIQTGIDILQGVESLKTDLINTGINTVADAIIGVFPQAEHPVSDLANLGTLTFETSRDTVNGTLEAISDLAGADFGGALGNATGVIGTLINNGSTAADIIQHIVGDDLLGGGILGSIGGGIGGDGGLLSPITGILGGDILGNLGGLLSINVGDNCGCTSSNGGVDSILDSVLGAASSSQILSASGSTTNFTDNLSIPSLNLSEQLFESTNLF